ncbi:MAG TPA: TRAP transporter large permease subunit, partial [Spirochaetales bacterium]|nr:TRAP transporter large permease subunit [Spirochaetales bacterium]
MLETLALLGTFLILILVGVPISFSLGISALFSAWVADLGVAMIAQRIAASLQSFPLLAIPLFILAGGFMAKGGV